MRTCLRRTRRLPVIVVLAVLATVSSSGTAIAQTPFVPYFGKNLVHYNTFNWQIYTTDHFEVYFYPEVEQHLERVVAYAESAYQQISADLRHDLAFKVPMILFKTHAEFEQENVLPGEAQEGVGAFAESSRNRMVLPMDDPPDLLWRLIVHELTHIFEFDIIPQSLIRRSVPLWVNEGLSDYETGIWQPIDLMTVRDAAVADIVPKMSDLEGYGNSNNPRLIYNLGHAVFEFIESKWGKEGIRQFLFALRKSVIGGGESAYEEAFQLKAEDFDQQFDKYLKDRFKPFRDKERPADYGKNLAPNAEKTKFQNVFSAEPSPSGDLIAAMTINRKDREVDIILISSKDGQIVKDLTPGFDKDYGFSHIIIPGSRFNTVGWMSWAPGDRLAYLVRGERERALILQDTTTRKIVQRVNLSDVDEPESPNVSPDGRRVAFSGLRGAVGDIFVVDLETKQVENVTNDDFADYGPVFSPDGRFLVYLARISGNEKLFRLDLDTKKKTQLTFGTHDDSAARFLDQDTIVFSSTATDPNVALEAEVSRNGNIYNIWTLSLKNGELKQYTDALGGNLSPIVIKDGKTTKIGFVAYYKGEYSLHSLDRKDPIVAANTSDFGSPGPIIDFQAPMTHTLVASNKKKKGMFEKLFVDGRPPVSVGITSGGDVFGGSAISFSDVLGDQRFTMYAASVAQYRQLAFSWVNLSKRLQWALQGFSQTTYFYGQLDGILYDPVYAGLIDRDLAVATRTIRGGSLFAIYPFNRFRRLELTGAIAQYNEEYNNPEVEFVSQCYQVGGPDCRDPFTGQPYPTLGLNQPLYRNGLFVPLGVALVQETTVFREFGPLAGNTVRLGYEIAPKIGKTLSRQTADIDARYYLRLGGTGLLALRGRVFKSWGDSPDFLYFGGNSEMHGYDYLSFIGQNAYFANVELRFPLIEAMLTPAGVIGGIRGKFFFNIGGASFNDTGYTFASNKAEMVPTVAGYNPLTGAPIPGPAKAVSGFRLVDGRASYGIGLETFALGFPIHFDWAYRTLFNKQWEDIVFALDGGSSAFRKARFQFWIGYDF
jgi:WD40 repeat protein